MAFDFDRRNNAAENENNARNNPGNGTFSGRSINVGSSGTDNDRGGFRNQPELRNRSTDYANQWGYESEMRNEPMRPRTSHRSSRVTRTRRVTSCSGTHWRAILPIIGVVLALLLCFIFREDIANFFSQFFSWTVNTVKQIIEWIIVIGVVGFIIKLILFGSGRRK